MSRFLIVLQLKELDEEWGKLPPTPPAPTRFTRSQQQKMAERGAAAPAATGGDDETTTDGGSVVFVLSLTIEVMHILILSHAYLQYMSLYHVVYH